MIARPFNDEQCLGQLLDRARDMRNSSTARNLAAGMGSPVDMARLLRGLPQRNDDGAGGGDAIACDTMQRLRNWPDDPNCFERTAMFVAVADRIEPNERWSAATVAARNGGRHTVPVLLGGRRPKSIDVNPRVLPRNSAAAVRNGGGWGLWEEFSTGTGPRNAGGQVYVSTPFQGGYLQWDDAEGRWWWIDGPAVRLPNLYGPVDQRARSRHYLTDTNLAGEIKAAERVGPGHPGPEGWQLTANPTEAVQSTMEAAVKRWEPGAWFDWVDLPRNADPWVQDFAGVVHTGGTVVLSVFGAGKAAEELGTWERKEGLLREEPKQPPSSTTATTQRPAPSTAPTEDDQWPKARKREVTDGAAAGLATW